MPRLPLHREQRGNTIPDRPTKHTDNSDDTQWTSPAGRLSFIVGQRDPC